MSDRKIIRNGLVHTLDKDCGYFNIVISGGKIVDIDQTGKISDEAIAEHYPDAEVIDASGKIIMPGIINANLNSSTRLSRIFFKRNIYDSLETNISLDILSNYFKSTNNAEDLYTQLAYSLTKSLKEGETSVVEVSDCITGEFYSAVIDENEKLVQNIMMCAVDSSLNDQLTRKKERHFVRFGREDNVTTYSLNALKKYVDDPSTMVCCDALNSEKAVMEIKNSFGKSPIKLLDDYGILGENVYFTNPIYINESDIELLRDKKAGVIFNTSDYIKLGKGRLDMNMLMDEGVRIVFGTGFLGNNILSELNIFGNLFYTPKLKYANLLKMAVSNPASYLGMSSKGSIAVNKDADLVFFDINQLGNIMSIPETDMEKVSEFIITGQGAGNISDVIKNGEYVVKNRTIVSGSTDGMLKKVNDLSEEIFKTGNYFEFKERYLMKKRVDEVRLDKKKKDYSDMPLDDAEITIGVDDGFKIIGVKKSEDYAKERPLFENQRRKNVFIREVKSLKNGLAVFSDKEKKDGVYDEFTEEKASVKESTNKSAGKSVNQSAEEVKEQISNGEKPSIKKMKFGFSDSGE